MLLGQRARLRPLRPDDDQVLQDWLSSWEGLHWYLDAPALLSGEELRRSLMGPFTFMAELQEAPHPALGLVQLAECSLPHRRAMLDVFIGADHRRGALGLEACSLALHYAFAVLGLNKVEARVRQGNEAALSGVLALGFSPEGVLREHVVRGPGTLDLHLFGLTAKDYWAEPRSQHLRSRFIPFPTWQEPPPPGAPAHTPQP